MVDAWAWIEYLIGSQRGKKVKEVMDEDGSEVYTCAVTVGEVISKVAREGKDVEEVFNLLLSNSKVVSVDEELSLQAGLLHCEMRKALKDFGLADAYVLATAKRLKVKILTGDLHFKGIKEAVLLK